MDSKSIIIKWLKRLILLGRGKLDEVTLRSVQSLLLFCILLFAIYLAILNDLVRAEFSKPLTSVHSTLSLEQYPKPLINMLLLVEDQSFFNHLGVDFKEISRVFRDYWLHDKPIRGASTLTQQLIKNTLLTRDQTISRKINEALMALLLEGAFH